MKTRDTLVGLVVLALVGAGVCWVRFRPAPLAWHPPEPPATMEEGRWPPSAREAEVPDVTMADGSVEIGDVRVTLSVTPRPPVAFAKTRVRVHVESRGMPVTLVGGRISFEMTMPMGDHRYALIPADDGWREADVVLPFCSSGNPRWRAVVEGSVSGRPIAATFRLDLTRPRANPPP